MEKPGKKESKASLKLSPLILGGAGFSYQLVNDPNDAPAVDILQKAFDSGVRTIDTSPYYDPSEQILGAALAHPRIAQKYAREDYVLMTKVGRIAADHFDYSEQWIKQSVQRSLERFRTTYLDVVFCHDVEFVSLEEAVGAVGALFQLADEGFVRHVGISGYKLDVISRVASLVLEKYGRPVDVVQVWAQLTLQNTRLETSGLPALRSAGVKAICASSPLAVGLLRAQGVPIGKLGDWHPAPEGLRRQAYVAAEAVEASGENISALALRYAIRKAMALSTSELTITTITGPTSLKDITENVETARQVLGDGIKAYIGTEGYPKITVNTTLEQKDEALCLRVQQILGTWVDYEFS